MLSTTKDSKGKLYCIVKSVVPGQQFLVSYGKMKKHFPLSLLEYLNTLNNIDG